MNKKNIFILIAICIVAVTFITIIGLGLKGKTTDEEHVLEFLGEIKGYTSNVTIEIENDRGKNVYKAQQKYARNIGSKLEFQDGRTYLFKGGDIEVKDNHSGKEYTMDENLDEVLRYSFVSEYTGLLYINEELNFDTETVGDERYFIITTVIPGSNINMCKGSLYYSVDEHLPKKIIIYDNKGNTRVSYTYDNFKLMDSAEVEF